MVIEPIGPSGYRWRTAVQPLYELSHRIGRGRHNSMSVDKIYPFQQKLVLPCHHLGIRDQEVVEIVHVSFSVRAPTLEAFITNVCVQNTVGVAQHVVFTLELQEFVGGAMEGCRDAGDIRAEEAREGFKQHGLSFRSGVFHIFLELLDP